MNLKMMMIIRNATIVLTFQDKEIKISVVNIGNDVLTNDQFVCLIQSGLTTDSGYFEYTNFIDAIGDLFDYKIKFVIYHNQHQTQHRTQFQINNTITNTTTNTKSS